MPATPRGHAVSDIGLARSNNQDSGYAGATLFVVADGMGGHAGGDIASSLAVRGLRGLDQAYPTAKDAEQALRDGFVDAQASIAAAVAERPRLAGMGTTVSAIAIVGDQAAIVHIGDSRIYRLRGGKLDQVTTDHTFVQRLVETGRITPEEAAHHPRRSVLMRVLGDIDQSPEVDSEILDTVPGDRWMLCSDGLSGCVDDAMIQRLLIASKSSEEATAALLREALNAGAPDNVTVVVVDIDAGPATADSEAASTVGAAAEPLEFSEPRTRSHARLPSLLRHPLRSAPVEDSHFEPETDEYLAALVAEDRRRLRRRRVTAITLIVLAVAVVVASLWLAYQWTQTQYYVGAHDGRVAVFQGVQQDLGPISLHHLEYVTTIDLDSLPTYRRELVEATISRGSLAEADETVRELQHAAR